MKQKAESKTLLDRLKEYIETDEGKKALEDFFEKINNKEKIENYQYEKWFDYLKEKENLDSFIEKVNKKYDSDAYCLKEIKKGYQPRESLKYFLYGFAEIYGDEVNDDEWEKCSNMFTTNIYKFNDWYFELIQGQGSMIHIFR